MAERVDPPENQAYRDRQHGETTVGAPRWVKVSGVVALIIVGLLVVMLLVGGGNHGPGRHTEGGEDAPRGVTDHTPPEGGHTP